MIDLQRLRKEADWFRSAWQRRGLEVDVDALLALDADVRQLKSQAENLRAEANQASKAIGKIVREGGDIAAARAEAGRLGDEAKALDDERQGREADLQNRLMELPNPVQAAVPDGLDEHANRVVRSWGEPPELPCAAEPHWDIAPRLGLIDFERGTRLSGSGFVVYTGLGARLNRALINWFLDQLTGEHGYREHAVPILVRTQVMEGTGQLPKFADQSYAVPLDELHLIPTAEVPLTNLYAGEIFEAEQLPLRLTAHTPCFRREAGAAGVGTRGIQRVHQFDKVEMVQIVAPETSDAALETMTATAEDLLQRLDLHYRVLELCAGDTGFSSAHTYDLEVWSPGTGTWLEVSSCSNCEAFQARRIPLRYRDSGKGKPEPVHTLNGSGLALPRVVIALLESNLQADGSVLLPSVLRPYLGGVERLTPVETD